MSLILLIIIVTSWLLVIMGTMPFWMTGALSALCIIWLIIIAVTEQIRRFKIRRRCGKISATYGLNIVNLVGLPMDIQAQAVLFAVEDGLLIESDQATHKIGLDQINMILMLTTKEFRQLSDVRISSLLGISTIHSFSKLRSMISNNELKTNLKTILILSEIRYGDIANIYVLATARRCRSLVSDFSKNALLDSITYLAASDGKRQ